LSEVNVKGPRQQSPLLSWHWLAALLVMVFNDHALKGAGVLPPWLTGKLSDFAGLYVVPVAIAWSFSWLGVGSWRQLIVASAAVVGGVFSSLQVSETCARGMEQLTAAAGIPWVVTPDPTDLIALSTLLLGVAAFWRRSPGREPRARISLRERTALAAAVLACGASSIDDGERPIGSSSNQPALVNGSKTETVEVRLQSLRNDLQLDCEAIAEDPGRMLPRAAFDATQRYRLQPLEIAPFDRMGIFSSRSCSAVLIQLDGREPRLVFWFEGDIEARELLQTARKIPSKGKGAILVEYDDESIPEQFRDLDGELLYDFEPRDDARGQCSVSSGQWQMLGGEFAFNTTMRLDAVQPSLDGCQRLELSVYTPPPTSDEAEASNGAAPPGDFFEVNVSLQQSVLEAGVEDSASTFDAGAVVEAATSEVDASVALDAGTAPEAEAAADRLDEADAGSDVTTGDPAVSEPAGDLEPGDPPSDTTEADVGVVEAPDEQAAEPPVIGPSSAARTAGAPAVLSVCVPSEDFPFVQGDALRLLGSENTPQLAVQDGSKRLTLFQNFNAGRYVSGAVEIIGAESSTCDFVAQEEPAAALRLARVSVESAWGQFEVDVGDSHTIEEGDLRLVVGLSAATEQVLGETLGITYSGYLMQETGQP
jgi:hypothetical protein